MHTEGKCECVMGNRRKLKVYGTGGAHVRAPVIDENFGSKDAVTCLPVKGQKEVITFARVHGAVKIFLKIKRLYVEQA